MSKQQTITIECLGKLLANGELVCFGGHGDAPVLYSKSTSPLLQKAIGSLIPVTVTYTIPAKPGQ